MNLFGAIVFTVGTVVWAYCYKVTPSAGNSFLSVVYLLMAAFYWGKVIEDYLNAK